MNIKKICALSMFVFGFVFLMPNVNAQVATSTKEQKIEVISPSGKGGGEYFKRGESIPYTFSLTKNSKKLEVSLSGGPDNKTIYKVKRYDGWGINKKVIAGSTTSKFKPGDYMLTICDYTNKEDVICDSSDGVITITDETPASVATSTASEQKIEIKSPNGGEQFYRGENIPYNYHLKKNTKNLLIELVEADKNTVEFSVKRYDGWGDNRKIISKEQTKKIPTGMYILRICDTSTRIPVCDVSDGRITIVDKIPMSKITAIIDKNSLKTTSSKPIITGYANDVQKPFGYSIVGPSGDKVDGGEIVVGSNNKWSFTVSKVLTSGSYKINLYSNNKLIKTETLVVRKQEDESSDDSDDDDDKRDQTTTNNQNINTTTNTSSNNSSDDDDDDSDEQGDDTRGQTTTNNQNINTTTAPNSGMRVPQDACKNIPGDQASVPKGWTNVGVIPSGNCKKIEEGDSVDDDQRKSQEQKIEKVCQILQTKITNGRVQTKETEWKNVKCQSDAFKNAKPKERRTIEKKVEKAKQSSSEEVYSISTDLEVGATHEFVKTIQKYLNSNGYIVNENLGEPGSIGYESDYFGKKTQQALIKFQKDKGITPAQGYFGPKTRAVMGI